MQFISSLLGNVNLGKVSERRQCCKRLCVWIRAYPFSELDNFYYQSHHLIRKTSYSGRRCIELYVWSGRYMMQFQRKYTYSIELKYQGMGVETLMVFSRHEQVC